MPAITRRSVLANLAAIAFLPAELLFARQTHTRKQYVYVLRVTPRFHKESSWTRAENAAVGKHLERLAKAANTGQVILAGRTNEALDKTFGLVIFDAENEAAANAFMESDPAVVAGLMTATLHPYSVALGAVDMHVGQTKAQSGWKKAM
jgi:uncharacterized protein